MPTALDAKVLPKVQAAITRIGVDVTLYESDGTYSPSTGSTTGGGASHAAKGTPPLDFDVRMVDGDTIQRGDCLMYLAGKDLGFSPRVGWSVATGGKTWRVVAVRDLRSGEQTAAWELQLRR